MKKAALLAETQRHRMLETAGINTVQGANLITVDVQPEYQNYFGFQPYAFGAYINESYDVMSSLTFLFNGPDLGFPSEEEYHWWLIEECGVEEEIIASAYFFDKGYAFFRYCMDEGIDDDDIVTLIQYMVSHDISDTRDINTEMWNNFVASTDVDQSNVRDLMENADDMLKIPDLMDFLKNYGGKIVLTGGGINECLKEVEIALMALQKPYNVLTQYTY